VCVTHVICTSPQSLRYWATAINCVTLMDDDVILPDNWSQEKCNKLFQANPR
jgi:hypothetical protein